MSHDVFICHSSKDRSIANAICSTLEQQRIRCWVAPRDVVPGSDYAKSIVEAISGSKLTVLVFSDESNHSTHVRREIERSVSHGIPILPFRVEDVVPSPSLEYFISDAHWLDAVTPPLEQHLRHLAGTVQVLLDRERTSQATGAPLPAPVAGPPAPALEPPRVELTPHEPSEGRGRRAWIWAGAAGVVGLLVVGLVAVGAGGGGDGETVRPSADGVEVTIEPQAPRTSAPAIPDVDTPEFDEPTGPTAPAPETTVAPTPEPTLPVADEPVAPAADTVVPVESPELGAPIHVLDSFAFTQTIAFDWEGGALTMVGEGVFVAPDRQSCTNTAEMAGFTFTSQGIVADGRAWYDDGMGGGLVEVDPDDSMLRGMLAGCATSEEMWAGDWSEPPDAGAAVTIDGQELVAYDVSKMSTSWSAVFGLPPGVTAERMILYVSPDRTWVAGMDAAIAASAETLRTYFGFPPVGVEGDCHMSMTVMIQQPNDPALAVVPPW